MHWIARVKLSDFVMVQGECLKLWLQTNDVLDAVKSLCKDLCLCWSRADLNLDVNTLLQPCESGNYSQTNATKHFDKASGVFQSCNRPSRLQWSICHQPFPCPLSLWCFHSLIWPVAWVLSLGRAVFRFKLGLQSTNWPSLNGPLIRIQGMISDLWCGDGRVEGEQLRRKTVKMYFKLKWIENDLAGVVIRIERQVSMKCVVLKSKSGKVEGSSKRACLGMVGC